MNVNKEKMQLTVAVINTRTTFTIDIAPSASINEIRADIIVKMYFWPRDVDDSSMKLWKVHALEKTRGLYTLDDSTEPPTPIFSENELTKAFAEEAPQGIVHLMATEPRPRRKKKITQLEFNRHPSF